MTVTALSWSQLTLGFLLAKEAEGVAPATLTAYRVALGDLARSLPPDRLADLSLLSTADLHTWVVNMAHRGLASATRDQRISKCKSFLAWAHREGFLPADLGAGLKRPRRDWQPQPLTVDEVSRLLSTARAGRNGPRNYAIIAMLVDCGLRSAELCALTPTDVDLRTGAVVVRPEGAKNHRGRTVYVGKRTRDAIWRWMMVRPPNAERMFVTEEGRPLERVRLRVIVATVGARAGIAGRVYRHRLRHSFALLYLRSGGDAFSLQLILGHSDMTVTREYVKLSQQDVGALYRSPLDGLATQ